MPPRGSKVDRLSEAERKLDALRRQLARLEARPASVPSAPSGQTLGQILTSDHDFDTAGDVAAQWWDGSAKSSANATLEDTRDWLLMPDQTLLEDAHVVNKFMGDSEWFAASHRQVEYVVLATAPFQIGVASTTATLSLAAGGISGVSDGFSINAGSLRVKYKGEYGVDFGFINEPAGGGATQLTVAIAGGDLAGQLVLACWFPASSLLESRSGTATLITLGDDTDISITYTYTAGETPGQTDLMYLRVWSVNLYPR